MIKLGPKDPWTLLCYVHHESSFKIAQFVEDQDKGIRWTLNIINNKIARKTT